MLQQVTQMLRYACVGAIFAAYTIFASYNSSANDFAQSDPSSVTQKELLLVAVKDNDVNDVQARANATNAINSSKPSATEPTAQEVMVLELVNRARFNPASEAARYGIGLNKGIRGEKISPARKPPLAHNVLLMKAARNHSQWMLDEDNFSHTGKSGSSATERIKSAGYSLAQSWSTGENISWNGASGGNVDLTKAAYDHHEGLFKSPVHRRNILSENFREIGIGHKLGEFNYGDAKWRASMLTQNFARSGSRYFLTGVIYSDNNGDDFYNVGVGLSGITISINGKSHAVFSTGAYSIPLHDGTHKLTVSGAALGKPVDYTVKVKGTNVKLDVVKGSDGVKKKTW